jgi:hypothetical protein
MPPEAIENEITNEELETYLLRYCASRISPFYAVMLEGPWGSGKTWFINRVREKLEDAHKKRCIYVSLYGVTQISDITDQFFQQVHPLLASKGVQRSWSILKSMVKLSLKVDLNRDKHDETLNISIPDLGDWTGPDGAVLIFDDFERCLMAHSEVLGFINQFVEHDGYRVLVLANESKVESGEKKFEEIKEKVIGRTFSIHPQVEQALDSFIDELVSDDSIEVLKTRKKLIMDVERRGGYGNLRLLRQAVLDFADMWSCLPVQDENLKDHSGFLDRLVLDMFSFSIEYRAGKIKAEHIISLKDGAMALKRLMLSSKETPVAYSEAENRLKLHNLTSSWELALLPKTYATFFSRGRLSQSEAAEGVTHSHFFINEQKPAWQQLWYRNELDDATFAALTKEVLSKVSALEYTEQGVLFHVVGILLDLAAEDLIPLCKEAVLDTAKGVVDQLAHLNQIEYGERKREPRSFIDREAAYGFKFFSTEMSEFQEFSKHYLLAVSSARARAFKDWASEWMTELQADAAQWASRININGGETAHFNLDPVFRYVEPATMVDLILKSHGGKLTIIQQAIEARYEHRSYYNAWQLEELPFWKDCAQRLSVALAERDQSTLSTFTLRKYLLPTVEAVVTALEEASGPAPA